MIRYWICICIIYRIYIQQVNGRTVTMFRRIRYPMKCLAKYNTPSPTSLKRRLTDQRTSDHHLMTSLLQNWPISDHIVASTKWKNVGVGLAIFRLVPSQYIQAKSFQAKKNHPDDVLHNVLPEIGRENRGKIPQLHPGVIHSFWLLN